MEPGTKVVRGHLVYRVEEYGEDEVTMLFKYGGQRKVVTETRRRFDEEVEAGRAVVHPPCPHCGLPFDPADATEGMHYQCWFEGAGVRERCEAAAGRPGWPSTMASRALASGDPRGFLLGVIGDPAVSLHDRHDAEHLLSGAVPIPDIIDAWARCPECLEGEAFEVDPHTGEVSCHCGETLKPADGVSP